MKGSGGVGVAVGEAPEVGVGGGAAGGSEGDVVGLVWCGGDVGEVEFDPGGCGGDVGGCFGGGGEVGAGGVVSDGDGEVVWWCAGFAEVEVEFREGRSRRCEALCTPVGIIHPEIILICILFLIDILCFFINYVNGDIKNAGSAI